MISKRPVLLITTSLFTMGILYFGVFKSPSDQKFIVEDKFKIPPAPNPTAKSASGLTSPIDQRTASQNQELGDSEVSQTRVRGDQLRSASVKTTQSATRIDVTASQGRYLTDAPAEEKQNDETKDPQVSVGIRLAPDVRLPLAAMPNDLKLNPIKQRALQHIIDEYYQNVAAVATAPENSQVAGSPVIEENGEATHVISNSPRVESARLQADLRFKAIFGKAAYTRMTMNTLLEARLPAIPAER